MGNLYNSPFSHVLGLNFWSIGFGGAFLFLIALAAIWTIAWKGFALWFSARNDQKIWFIVFLFVNTLGILEIIYLLFFRADGRRLFEDASLHNQSPITPEPEITRTTIIEEVVVDE